MQEYYKIHRTTLASIANSIRNKRGISDKLTPEQMAAQIDGIIASGKEYKLQEKTVVPTSSVQVVTADKNSGYDALSKVTVMAVVDSGDGTGVSLRSIMEVTF